MSAGARGADGRSPDRDGNMSMTGPVVGVLLAGGLARRMGGGDKSLLDLGGGSILERVIGRARPQVDTLVLNANGDPERFAPFGLPVVADVIEGFAGPLAGVLTGMTWAAETNPDAEWVASFATDAPFLPEDLVARLAGAIAADDAEMACAMSAGRTHPVFALWPVRLKDELRRAMEEEEMRKIDRWTARYGIVHVDFTADDVDPFFNVNRPENLEEARRLLDRLGPPARGVA